MSFFYFKKVKDHGSLPQQQEDPNLALPLTVQYKLGKLTQPSEPQLYSL